MSEKERFYRIMEVVTAALAQVGYDPSSQLTEYVQAGNPEYKRQRNATAFLCLLYR